MQTFVKISAPGGGGGGDGGVCGLGIADFGVGLKGLGIGPRFCSVFELDHFCGPFTVIHLHFF
mgnify:CR=1 FL=1